jgi:hypothetical protein
MITEELRVLDRLTPRAARPRGRRHRGVRPRPAGIWFTSPFVTTDEPVLGRPVTGGRPASFLALEDKMLADEIWAAADVPCAPYASSGRRGGPRRGHRPDGRSPRRGVVRRRPRTASTAGATTCAGCRTRTARTAAYAFFAPRCDRVRVMPFLDGVPCSIHGFVLPDGTAALRPVEIAMLRNVTEGLRLRRPRHDLGPAGADREEMRAIARRVGATCRRPRLPRRRSASTGC